MEGEAQAKLTKKYFRAFPTGKNINPKVAQGLLLSRIFFFFFESPQGGGKFYIKVSQGKNISEIASPPPPSSLTLKAHAFCPLEAVAVFLLHPTTHNIDCPRW